MFTNFVTFAHADGQTLPPNETISSHRLEEPAVHVKCCLLCEKEPKCVGFNYRATTMNGENCQLTNVTRNSNTSKTGDWALYLDMEAVTIPLRAILISHLLQTMHVYLKLEFSNMSKMERKCFGLNIATTQLIRTK